MPDSIDLRLVLAELEFGQRHPELAEAELKKIIELDGRPSDCIAMATQQKAPVYVSQDVWDEVDDMSDVLRKMEEEGLKADPEAEE